MTEEDAVRSLVSLAYAIADDYYLPGGDRDDLRQEALLAALLAVRSHRPGPNAPPLRAYAAIVVRRRLSSAIRTATRPSAIALAYSARDETLASVARPDGEIEAREDGRRVLTAIRDRLNPRERRAILLVAAGYRYDEIGPSKTVDNLVQSARRKLRVAA